ncbi:MAG: response regulator [Emticicia sp.]|uniref:response regulator n=1 Tax=Emticicia sp. TaxID=1930953 RepID=UPI003BA5058E
MKISVLIADDHKLLAETLSNTLNATQLFDVVAVCHTSKDTLWNIQLLNPQIVLLDLNMPLVSNDSPRLSGLEVLEELKTNNSKTRSIVISSHSDYNFIKQSLNLGAKGYLFKNTSIDEIEKAILTVLEGNIYLQKEAEEIFKNKQRNHDNEDTFAGAISLTKREKEVLGFISRGFRTEDIAIALNLKKYTVDEYRDNLVHKMKAKNSAELIRIAFETGLL